MAAQKPKLSTVLSDSSRIIISNSPHFLTLSFLFIFPVAVFNAVNTFRSAPALSHGGFLSKYSEFPSMDKSQIISKLLHSIPFLLLNICSVISITNSVFLGFHDKPLNLSSSLKSIIFSFFPLLATRIAFLVLLAAIIFGSSFLVAFFFVGLALLGYSIEPNSTQFMVGTFVMTVVVVMPIVYLEIVCFLMDVSVVVEEKWGFAAIRRSWNLVKGRRGVVLLIMVLFWVFEVMVDLWRSSFAGGRRRSLMVEMGVNAAVSTLFLMFSVAVKTVFFVYSKAAADGGDIQLPATDKLGQPYIQLTVDDDSTV